MRLTKNSKLTCTYDTVVTVSFAMFFIADILRAGYQFLLTMLGLEEMLGPFLVLLTIYGPLVFIIHQVDKASSFLPFFFVMGISAILFFLSLAIHPEYAGWFNHETYGVLDYIFRPDRAPYLFLFILLCRTNEEVFKNLKIAAYLVFAGILLRFLMIVGVFPPLWSGSESLYSMSLGYDALIVAIIFISHFLRARKFHLLLFSLFSIFLMIRYGSRMPLVVFIFYLMVVIISKVSKYTKIRKIKYISILSIIIIVSISMIIFFKNEIISISSSYSASSRTLQMLIEGNFTSGSGRERIYMKTIEVIRDNPIIGVGLYGDRFHLTNVIKYGYPHNIALEIIVTFGIIPGTVMLLTLSYNVIKKLLKSIDENWIDSTIIFVSISLQLLVSYSYWYVPAFWGLLAMLHPKRVH